MAVVAEPGRRLGELTASLAMAPPATFTPEGVQACIRSIQQSLPAAGSPRPSPLLAPAARSSAVPLAAA